ncbi:MAG: TolC family protein, partial [Fibrobacterota bacterium]|nr:TolC family protein [Fibrobacterota bacterium]
MLLILFPLTSLLLVGGIVPVLALDPSGSPVLDVESEGDFTLKKAFALALLHNPDLAGYALEVRIQESVRLQSGLRSNPEVSLEVEDFGVGGSHAGFGKSQTTLRLGQRIELGGKRSARMNAASRGADKAGWEYESKRLEILKRVSQAYIDVIVAQRGQGLAEEAVRLADQIAGVISLRGRVGRSSVVEEAKAKVASANARIEWEWSKQRLEESRRSLAVLWGAAGSDFGPAKDILDSAAPPPPFDTLKGYL